MAHITILRLIRKGSLLFLVAVIFMADNKKINKKDIDDVKQKNSLFTKLMGSIGFSAFNTRTDNEEELSRITLDIDEVINGEINKDINMSSDDLSLFMMKSINEANPQGNINMDKEDIFNAIESESLFSIFNNKYKNKNALYADLRMISEQLFEMEAAIQTTRDSIITSDDLTNVISRKISFGNIDSGTDKYQEYILEIEKMEKDFKLHKTIKNQIVNNVLTYGEYYAYECPYTDLFQQQLDRKDKTSRYIGESLYTIIEATTEVGLTDKFPKDVIFNNKQKLTESFITTMVDEIKVADKKASVDTDNITKFTKECLSNIYISNESVALPLLEYSDLSDLLDTDKFKKTVAKAVKNSSGSKDGVFDTNKKTEKISAVPGCYVKYIGPESMIPVTILDHVIGYYFIQAENIGLTPRQSPFTSSGTSVNSSIFNPTRTSLNGSGNDSIESVFVGNLTDKIVQSFNRKYLEDNIEFKSLIYNALKFDELYKKKVIFQFIPAKYVTKFTINTDSNGDGHSVLLKSMFYAKLYLGLLIFKMTSIIEKSNDTTVYYIKNSGYDTNIRNKVQQASREIKKNQFKFLDMLNYSSMINRVGSARSIFIPVGKDGEKGFEADILSGQDVQINTDFMEFLRTNMMNGTGVPSVLLNYINEADYAKTLIMANSKFVSYVIGLQTDLNDSITDHYKKILRYNGTSIPENILDSMEFTFNPPKTLNVTNNMDLINNADQITSYIIKTKLGENKDQSLIDNVDKDKLYKSVMEDLTPSINWGRINQLYEAARIETTKELMDDKVRLPESE